VFHIDLFTLGILVTHIISAAKTNIKTDFQVQSRDFWTE